VELKLSCEYVLAKEHVLDQLLRRVSISNLNRF